MQALVLTEYRKFTLADVPRPELGPTDVLVRVAACGICGGDVHGYDGSSGRRIPPIVMGHEAAGTIAAMGKGVSGWAEGDRVTFDSTIYCGECRPCARGDINLCDRRQVLGVSCGDYRRAGAFADFVAVPARILHRLPQNLSFAEAALLEAAAVAIHAVSLAPDIRESTALVVGAGTIGLLLQQALRVKGCARVFVADVDPTRLRLSRELGAAEVLSGGTELGAEIRQLTNGDGVDLAIEAVGKTETVVSAIESVRKGGS